MFHVKHFGGSAALRARPRRQVRLEPRVPCGAKMSDSASARVAWLRSKAPRTALVVVLRAGLLHAAHAHAQMLGLQHHDDALGVQLLDERVGYLRGQALLHLRALREHVHQARELRQPADAPVGRRDVGHVRHAEKRHQMVLAHRVEGDVAHQHHFLVVLVERACRSARTDPASRPANTSSYIRRHAFRRLAQALAIGILPDPFQSMSRTPASIFAASI